MNMEASLEIRKKAAVKALEELLELIKLCDANYSMVEKYYDESLFNERLDEILLEVQSSKESANK